MMNQPSNNEMDAMQNGIGGSALDTSLISASFQQQPQPQPQQPMMSNATSIEQQLDLKYKAYSTMNSNTGLSGAQGPPPGSMPTSATKPVASGMLPNNSQFLYAANQNLRTSMEKQISNDGQVSLADLASSGQLSQQQQQFLNMNASMGSQQNQNLGPTQIFYQGPPPQQTNLQNPSNALPSTAGLFGSNSSNNVGGAPGNANILAQLMSQQQNVNNNNGSANQATAGQGGNTTQMLLLELLRQNNLQQQLNLIGGDQSQSAVNASSTGAQLTNPNNQSMYGQGFLSATQLLAQTAQGQPTANSNTAQMTAQIDQSASKPLPSESNLVTPGAGVSQAGSNPTAQTGYNQNLNQIYQNLNNYQSMIENLETGGMGGARGSQVDQLNQSKFQSNNHSSMIPINNNNGYSEQLNQPQHHHQHSMSSQPQNQTIVSFTPQQQPQQPQQNQRDMMADPEPTVSPHRASLYQMRQQSQYQNNNERGTAATETAQLRTSLYQEYDPQRQSQARDFGSQNQNTEGDRYRDDSNDNAKEEEAQIMWPSAMQQPSQPKQESFNQQHSKSTSNDGRQNNYDGGRAAQHRASLHLNNGSIGEEDETNMHTDFNYREDSSGFDRDLKRQSTMDAVQEQPNKWRNADQIDIDDIPIPTAVGEGPKTFEELLAEKMEADQALAASDIPKPEGVPKKEFLKRKKPAYVPPPPKATQPMKYKYYSDAIKEQNNPSAEDQQPSNADANPQRNNRRSTVQHSDERNDRRRIRTPNAATQSSLGRGGNEHAGQMQGQNNQELAPQGDQLDSAPRPRNVSHPPQSSQTPSNQASRPFLRRGQGTAHLQGRLKNTNNNVSSNNLHSGKGSTGQQEHKPPTPKLEKNTSSNQHAKSNNLFQKQQRTFGDDHQQQDGDREPHQSMDEFQQMELACNSGGAANNPRQQRKKKLFDDSDSDPDQPQEDGNRVEDYENDMGYREANHRDQSPSQGRSNLVKKMFYKDNGQQPQGSNLQKKQQNLEDDMAKPYMNTQMEALLAKKQEQLEKAIQRYNQDNDALTAKKTQYDQLTRKVKIEQRELEAQRKRTNEEVERMKEDEMSKVRKEKRALEQRQKNFQLVSNTAKKEREEIDQLRREYNKYKSETELKAKKQQSQIERLTKQNNELKQKNKELSEDLRAMEQQRIILERSGPSNQPGSNNLNRSTNQQVGSSNKPSAQSRYSFNNNGGNNRSGGAQQRRQNSNANHDDVLKGQMLFQDEDDDLDDEEGYDNGQLNNDDQRNNQYGDDEDEEDLHEEEADQVFDDFEMPEPRGANRGAVANTVDEKGQENNMLGGHEGSDYEGAEGIGLEDVKNSHKHSTAGAALSDEEEDFSLKFPKEYHSKTLQNQKVVEQFVGHDGKIQRIYQNGKKEVIFNNGVKRESFPDGYTIVYFNNQDIKQTYADGKVVYFFAEAQTTQTTFPDKLQVFKFSNNQIEKHFPDKTKEIIFPDGTIKCIFEDGEEESIFPDGTIQKIEKSGIKAIEFANGQKDILYPDGIRVREFPDGKVRKTFPDGRTEVFQR